MSQRVTGVVRGHTPVVTLHCPGLSDAVDFVVDTGYTGWLSLPQAAAPRWPLVRRGFGRANLADGSTVVVEVCTTTVEWLGETRAVYVEVLPSGEPLLGFRMLVGTRLTLHEIAVEIERLA